MTYTQKLIEVIAGARERMGRGASIGTACQLAAEWDVATTTKEARELALDAELTISGEYE